MIVMLIGLAVAQAQAPTNIDTQQAVREGELRKADAEAFIARCGSRKFEAEVASNNAGKLRKAKILLCAKPTDSDEQWIATLEKAASQIEASPELSAEAKAKVTGEIRAAIGRVRGEAGAQAQAAVAPPIALPTPMPAPRSQPLVQAPPPRPPVARPQPVAIPVSKPRISISCPEPSEPGVAAPCFEFGPASLLMVRADEDLKSKVSLRFIRDGDPRGGIALGTMRRGQVVRARLPARVCAGVVRGRVEMQTIVTDARSGAEQVADTQGPYRLRC